MSTRQQKMPANVSDAAFCFRRPAVLSFVYVLSRSVDGFLMWQIMNELFHLFFYFFLPHSNSSIITPFVWRRSCLYFYFLSYFMMESLF